MKCEEDFACCVVCFLVIERAEMQKRQIIHRPTFNRTTPLQYIMQIPRTLL